MGKKGFPRYAKREKKGVALCLGEVKKSTRRRMASVKSSLSRSRRRIIEKQRKRGQRTTGHPRCKGGRQEEKCHGATMCVSKQNPQKDIPVMGITPQVLRARKLSARST